MVFTSFCLGDTRSADDLAVFTGMTPERLCLGCGLRVIEPFSPIATGERMKLFMAKLLMFVLRDVSAQTLNEEELALRDALKPLVENKDGHFIAAVTSLVQSLLEGRTDCPISGVFGADKTLSAAAMIAGLLVIDPTLQIMIVNKENVAAYAFAKHFLRLGLPDSINSPCAPRQPRWSLSHYFGRDPSHSMHLANEFGLTALASVSSSRPPQLGICCCR